MVPNSIRSAGNFGTGLTRVGLCLLVALACGRASAADGATHAWPGASTDAPQLVRPSIEILNSPVLRLKMRKDWDRHEERLLWSYLGLSAIDAYQTIHPPKGIVEANPVLSSWAGERPSAAEVLLFKGAMTYGLVRLSNRIPSAGGRRKVALSLLTSLQLSVDVHNERISGGIVFSRSRPRN